MARTEAFCDEQYIQWINQTASGDNSALGQIYEASSRVVYGIALTRPVAGNEPSDIVQDFGVRLAEGLLGSYDPSKGDFLPWIYRVTTNLIIDLQRKPDNRLQNRDSLEEMELEDSSLDPDEIAYTNERARKVREALVQLPPNQHQVLFMAFYQGMTQPEISQALKKPLGTVKSHIRRGMSNLRTQLSDLQTEQVA